ncbi:MAG: hypothetical protein Q8R32_03770, partial [bacterium]|nr:hypothetical protein [bacterium]
MKMTEEDAMLALGKRIKEIRLNPRAKLAAIMPELLELREALTKLGSGHAGSAFDSLVHFFNIVSKWHDRGLSDIIAVFEETNHGQHDEVLKLLRTLQQHLDKAGRAPYGMNRTARGETVTADRV